ncbi:U-scoloptoxin(01)-Cw1a-like [Penaeus chinensis]|uniref:U-scoloptoxin(01)-Cw1a-like n=1 Tax=Penaeus chinensis TaxID=139456 RepID=UPI001FB59403|nr:U-scoloptoxin(01)-Cw1a-like [Penaeus chinensis]XP_047490560.1 U-scoloptoxin(01)-Cw1a-like [Penaeus chinensis]
MKVFAAVLCLAAAASARMAYQFSDGYLDILGGDPQQAFSCDNRPYGYYADVANDCRIFHVCEPVTDELGGFVETAHYSFVCGNQTVFSQESLTCAHPEEAFPCNQAESLYDVSNADFGKIPEEGGIDIRVA